MAVVQHRRGSGGGGGTCLNGAMTTSSPVADFKSHEDQRVIAYTEMNYMSFLVFFGRTSYTEETHAKRRPTFCCFQKERDEASGLKGGMSPYLVSY